MSKLSLADKEFKARLIEIIEKNISDESFGVGSLAEEMGMSRSSLHRKIHSIAHTSASQFIRNIRLERAKEMLTTSSYSVSEIAFKLGFSHPSYFTKCFKEYTGMPPVKFAEIKQVEVPEEPHSDQKNLRLYRRIVAAGIVLASFVIILILANLNMINIPGLESTSKSNYANRAKSIAVLPFSNISQLDEDRFFTDGMRESVIAKLVRIKGSRIVVIDSIHQLGSDAYNLETIGRQFNVNFILNGRVQKQEKRAVVLIRLTDVANGEPVWTETFNHEYSDIFEIQSEIAKQVASSLSIMLSPGERQLIEEIPTTSIEAYSFNLQGRYFLNNGSFNNSIDNFKNATKADPSYAMAYSGLADAFLMATIYQQHDRDSGYKKAKEMAAKALELNPDLAEAHASMGAILCYGELKWEEAKNEFEAAIRLNPNSANAHFFYARLLSAIKEFDDARDHFDLALQLNPTSIQYYKGSISTYCKSFQPELALVECKKADKLFPDQLSIAWHFFHIYVMLKQEQEAVNALKRAMSYLEEDKKYADILQAVYNQSGMDGVYHLLIQYESEDINMGIIGMARDYAALGDNVKAIDCLEKAMKLQIPFLPNALGLQDFKNLYSEERFQHLLKAMGLEQYYQAEISQNR